MNRRDVSMLLLVLAMASAASRAAELPAPLADLHVAAGDIAVEYERATAEAPALGAFAGARATPLQVLLARETAAEAGAVVAQGYAAGLGMHFGSVRVAAAGEAPDPKAYVAEIEVVVAAAPVDVAENAVEIRQIGTACKSEGNSVACADAGGVPMAMGKRKRKVAGERINVKVRVFSPAPRVAVSEDTITLHYADGACRDGLEAAGFLAGRVAGNATSSEPVGVLFSSSAERLRCNAR